MEIMSNRISKIECGTPAGFNKHYRNKTDKCAPCLDAHREHMRNKKNDLRKLIQDYKIGVGCVDCGYNSHPEALDFDHTEDKAFDIARAVGDRLNLKSLMKEIQKCEIVCANCHRVRTSIRRK
jgi:hypothetical protein